MVAPHAGAWIETPDDTAAIASVKVSPLTQGRGLKPEIPSIPVIKA